MSQDAFSAHPELADKIAPAEGSALRTLNLTNLEAMLREKGLPTGWWYDDATREGMRAATLADHDGDLWVFGYGSLMWDPALRFAEVRRAYAPHHARRMILRDIYGGRGTATAPGLMAALDTGDGCHGLAFRIAAGELDTETRILWQREMIAPCYQAQFIPVQIDGQTVSALGFIADHGTELIAGDLTRAQQVDYLVTGSGFLGTSFDYLHNVVQHLHDLGLPDRELDVLLDQARHGMALANGRNQVP